MPQIAQISQATRLVRVGWSVGGARREILGAGQVRYAVRWGHRIAGSGLHVAVQRRCRCGRWEGRGRCGRYDRWEGRGRCGRYDRRGRRVGGRYDRRGRRVGSRCNRRGRRVGSRCNRRGRRIGSRCNRNGGRCGGRWDRQRGFRHQGIGYRWVGHRRRCEHQCSDYARPAYQGGQYRRLDIDRHRCPLSDTALVRPTGCFSLAGKIVTSVVAVAKQLIRIRL
jgi:hypothetical protein